MCYDIAYMTQKQEMYKDRYKVEIYQPEVLKVYHTTGFDHQDIPVITSDNPEVLQFFTWGLIPAWVRDPIKAEQLSHKTLNARGEEMFEKASYKSAALNRRCLVVVDGFFEHHHKGSKTFPYFIKPKADITFTMAGLWEEWRYEDLKRSTCTIVTTEGNTLLSQIHNNPKLKGPRMPLILDKNQEKIWLNEDLDIPEIKDMVKPFPDDFMTAHPVARLRGKSAGNTNRPDIWQRFSYTELDNEQASMF